MAGVGRATSRGGRGGVAYRRGNYQAAVWEAEDKDERPAVAVVGGNNRADMDGTTDVTVLQINEWSAQSRSACLLEERRKTTVDGYLISSIRRK
jgi:hypothetical protein